MLRGSDYSGLVTRTGILRAKALYRFFLAFCALVPLLRNGANRWVRSRARAPKQKLSRQGRNPATGILRAKARYRFFGLLSALVPLLRNGANRWARSRVRAPKQKLSRHKSAQFIVGDPYGNRTHVTTVKG